MSRKKKVFKGLRVFLLMLYLLLAIFPIVWIFLTSLKLPEDVYAFPVRYFIKHPTLGAYKYLFSFANFAIYFKNSIIICVVSSTISSLFAIMSGYVLARFNFRGRYMITLFLFFP